MMDAAPPPLVGFERPAIIRPAGGLWRPKKGVSLFQPPGIPGAAPGGAVLSYINAVEDASNLTTYNFGSFTIPRAGLLIAAISARRGGVTVMRTVSSISIDGNSAAPDFQASASSVSVSPAAFRGHVVAAGSRNVSATFSGDVSRAFAFVFLLENYSSATPYDTDGVNDNTTRDNIDVTLDIPAGGVAIYLPITGSSSALTFTYSTATKTVDLDAGGDGGNSSSGHKTSAAALMGHVENISWGTATNSSAIGASWG